MSGSTADFRVLGPLEVWLGDRRLHLGAPKQRALLAVLLVHANQTLSIDRLIDSLWGEAMPPDAGRALQYHVSRLRASLRQGSDELAEQLVTQSPGYRFEVDEARIDAVRFAEVVRRAHRLIEVAPADAAALLAGALGEWRGPALADVEYADFAQPEVRRLDELRFAAVVDRIGADLAAGADAELIGQIEVLLVEHPSNERLWAHLMVALHRAGRTREALDGFQRARGELAAAGVSPSKLLVDLESRIVTDDPGLEVGSVGTSQGVSPALPAALELLADEATFVGRAGEQTVLRDRWRRASDGHTFCALVTGEAGIGKSRLVAELAAEVRAGGGRVLFGACFEDVDRPYAPFVQAIAADAAGLGASDVRRRAGEGRVALAWLSGDLAETLDVARDETAGAPSERGVMLDGVAGWFAATESPTLLIIEDLHWATATTRDALRRLIEMSDRAPLLVVATARDTPPDLDPELAGLLGDLERLPNVEALRVRGLDHDEVAELVGNDQAADVARIVAETGGSPLLVSHVTGGDDRPGWTLEALLARRDGLLDDAARTVVDLAATFGAEFDADLLAAAQGVSLLAVLESLESAEAAGLVVPQPGRPGRFAFVHALFRSHRYQALPLRQRLELHARAASALAGRADDRLLSESARHACLAVPVGGAAVAVDLARRAGEVAEHAYALDEAAAHYRRGLDAAAALDSPDRSVERGLRIRLGAALHHSADRTGLDMLVDAADEARRDGDGDALVQAALAIPQVGGSAGLYFEPHRILAITENALSACTDEPTRALLTIDRATQVIFTNRPDEGSLLARGDEGFQLARDAEEMARRNGDPRLVGRVLAKATARNIYPTDTDEGERVAAELVTLGEQLDRVDLTLAGLLAQASVALAAGDLVRWRGLTDRIASTLGDRSLPYVQTRALIYSAVDAFFDGDLDRTMNLVRTVGQRVRRMGEPGTLAQAMTVTVRRMQARDVELRPGLERIAGLPGDPLLLRSFLAAAYAREGAIDEARRVLASLRDDGWPFPNTYVGSVAARELAEAAEVTDDPDAAQRAIVECTPFAGGIASTHTLVLAPFDQALAQASLGAGDAEAAEAHAERAVAASRQRGTPLFLARELVFLAEARRRNGVSAATLRPLVAEALAIAERTGARVVNVDVERYGLPT